jgi:hypothetical protein
MGQLEQTARELLECVLDRGPGPDGSYLATAAAGGIARLMLRKTEDLVRDACRRVVRNLIRDEWDRHVGIGERRKASPEI